MAAPASPTAPRQPSGNPKRRRRTTGRLKIPRLTARVSPQQPPVGEGPDEPDKPTDGSRIPATDIGRPRPAIQQPGAPPDLPAAEEDYAPPPATETEEGESAGNEPSSPKFGPEQLKDAEESAIGQPPEAGGPTAPEHTGRSAGRQGSADAHRQKPDSDIPADEKSLYNKYAPPPSLWGLGKFAAMSRRKKTIFGSGLLGTIVGLIFFFTIGSGPMQFVHIAKLLEQFHFSTLQSQQDNRFMHEVRYLRYVSQGDAARARLSFVGNHFTDQFEAKVRASGLIPRYSPKAGKFLGYEIDRTNPDSPYHGMSDQELAQTVKENLGVDIAAYNGDYGSIDTLKKGSLMVEAPDGYFSSLRFNNGVLQKAGYSKLASVLGTRLFCLRAGCSLHPLVNLVAKTVADKEKAFNSRQEEKINKGQSLEQLNIESQASDQGSAQQQKETAQTAADQAKAAGQFQQEASGVGQDAAGGNRSAVSTYAAKLKGEFGTADQLKSGVIGGTFLLSAACLLRGLDAEAGQIKQAQVILPAMRMGMDAIALGSQVQSGQGVDLTQLGFYAKQLSGTDQAGRQSTWYDAKSIQSELGNPDKGYSADATLKTATDVSTPFSVLSQGTVGSILGPVCSGPGQFVTGVLGFFGAKLADIALIPVQTVLIGQLEPVAAHWLAGQAIDPFATGADYGNTINYGAALAANDQAAAAGGVELTSSQSALLKANLDSQYNQDFARQNILAKIFNPTDSRTVVGKILDRSSGSFSRNAASLASMMLNIGHSFASLGQLFNGRAVAASSSAYDYGFPQIGFSAADMDNPAFDNPFENACYVVGCPDKGITGILENPANVTKYSKMASDCFGVSLAQESVSTSAGQQMQWGVTTASGSLVSYKGNTGLSSHPECASQADPDWLRIRFFILDTETMNSMGCYEGDDQSCTDIGLAGSSTASVTPPAPASTGPAPTGSAQQLAQQLVPYVNNGTIKCVGSGGNANCSDITDTAAGTAIPRGQGCDVSALSPGLLGMLLKLVQMGHSFSLSALCSDHGDTGTAAPGHSTGQAADFNTIDGVFMGPNDVPWDQTKIQAGEKLDQDIASFMPRTTGFGQIQCHPVFGFLIGFNTFNDTCHHQHVQVVN